MGGENQTSLQRRQHRHKPHFSVYLRTPHADYLEHVSRRDDIPLSRVVANIVAATTEFRVAQSAPSQKERREIVMEPDELDKLNLLVVIFGVNRSEIIRRLIDKAMTDDPILRLAG